MQSKNKMEDIGKEIKEQTENIEEKALAGREIEEQAEKVQEGVKEISSKGIGFFKNKKFQLTIPYIILVLIIWLGVFIRTRNLNYRNIRTILMQIIFTFQINTYNFKVRKITARI